MDIIVRGIKSGLPVNDGLKLVAKECSAPLGPEFQRLVENVAIGMSLEQALDKMSEHVPAPELRFFAIVIAIQQKSGGNLSEALGNLSTVLRARKMMREKIKALSSEAIASASIIGCLPPGVALMIFITRPDYISIMFTNVVGNLMLMGGAVWMVFAGVSTWSWSGAVWLVPIGVLASWGQWCMTRAYARAGSGSGTLLVANLQYSGIVFSALMGYWLFDDDIPLIGWAGMALIVASGIAATVVRGRAVPDAPAEER